MCWTPSHVNNKQRKQQTTQTTNNANNKQRKQQTTQTTNKANKQLEVKTNRASFSCGNRIGHHNKDLGTVKTQK